jgi:hypothetical protein
MTHLRNLMLEELERRNYSQSTVRAYLMTIKDVVPNSCKHFRPIPFSSSGVGESLWMLR